MLQSIIKEVMSVSSVTSALADEERIRPADGFLWLGALRLLAGIRHGIQLYRNLEIKGTERARTCAISRTTAERNVEETGSPCFFWELSIKTEVMMILLNE